MAFSLSVKRNVQRRAHFACCICFAKCIQIHHIIPQEVGGPDTEENAAPLCPSCHDIYGANPIKRRFITDTRDAWYQICERRFSEKSTIKQLKKQKISLEKMIGRNKSSNKGTKWMTIEQIISHLCSEEFSKTCTDIDGVPIEPTLTASSILDILLAPRFWNTPELKSNRKKFLRYFGYIIGCRVVLQVLSEQNFSLGRRLTLTAFAKILTHFQTMVMLLIHESSIEPNLGALLGERKNFVFQFGFRKGVFVGKTKKVPIQKLAL